MIKTTMEKIKYIVLKDNDNEKIGIIKGKHLIGTIGDMNKKILADIKNIKYYAYPIKLKEPKERINQETLL